MGQGPSNETERKPRARPKPKNPCQVIIYNNSQTKLAIWIALGDKYYFAGSIDPDNRYISPSINYGAYLGAVAVSWSAVAWYNANFSGNYHPEAHNTMLTSNFRQWEGVIWCGDLEQGRLIERYVY